jgi:hypothetical protein
VKLPDIRITESHPKALLWLLHVAKVERPIAKVSIGHLSDLIESESPRLSDHERDAALAALAALGLTQKQLVICSRTWIIKKESKTPPLAEV